MTALTLCASVALAGWLMIFLGWLVPVVGLAMGWLRQEHQPWYEWPALVGMILVAGSSFLSAIVLANSF